MNTRDDNDSGQDQNISDSTSSDSPNSPDLVGIQDRSDGNHDSLGQLMAEDTATPETDTSAKRNFDSALTSGFFSFRIPVSESKSLILPNQKVGEHFELVLEDLKNCSTAEWDHLPDGVVFDTESAKLSGVPEKDGQYKIRVVCSDSLKEAKIIEYALLIIPDPKTLWKNLPTDKNAPFWKADLASEIDSTQNIYAVAASNRGRSHAHEGKFREDDYSVMCVGPSTWSVFAVADGGGSYKYSRRGSEIAAKHASKRLAALLENHVSPLLETYDKPKDLIHEDQQINSALYKSLIKASFDAALAIKEEAERFGESPKEFSTTLLLVAVKKFSIGHVIVGFNIGDGASGVIFNDRKDLYLLCVPESGEFAGQTRFLSTDEFKEENNQASRLRICVVENFDAIAVMSDGVSDAKFPNDNSLHEVSYWSNLIFEDWAKTVMPDIELPIRKFPETVDETRKLANQWLDYWAPGTHDDRTLIVAFPKEV